MQLGILSVFLLVSSSQFISTAVCDPNHHHNHNNDFPWQNILSSLGIVIENRTSTISSIEPSDDTTIKSKEQYTSESSVEILKSETKDEIKTPVAQNGTTFEGSSSYDNGSSGLGYKIGIPIVSIIIFIGFWYLVCKCCCACCQKETPGVIVMQSNAVQTQQPPPAAPQIILQQPIIHQSPPMYDAQQRWAQPPPQGHPQWNQPPPHGHSQWIQPPQGPPQWTPHPMSGQQQYSPHGGYDNDGFNPATAPPPYNTGKY